MPVDAENKAEQILFQTRSEEAQEIIGREPPWFVRWGILIVCLMIIFNFIILGLIQIKGQTVFKILFR